MIAVERGSVRPPNSLFTSRVEAARRAASQHFRASDARARQSLHRFEPLYAARDVRETLRDLFSNKCAFCESPLGGTVPGDVHHLRPKQGAVDPRTGEASRRHYWWLAYEWENLYLTCARCSRSAGARFPVAYRRARGGTTGDGLRDEGPLLLDPCADDPSASLLFQLDGSILAGDERAAMTVESFALNRPSLIRARLDRLHTVRGWLSSGGAVLEDVLEPSAPYAGMLRQLLGALLEAGPPSIDRVPTVRSARTSAPDRSESVRVVRTEIVNFRAISQLALEFQSEPDSWTMLLGENGDGKSSVLQALAIALMDGSQRSRLDSATYLRHGAQRGHITVELSDRSTREIEFAADEAHFRSAPANRIVLAGYGAYRAPGKGAPRRSSTPRVNSILSPYVRLISPTEWLLSLDRRTFDAAAASLRRLLLDDEGFFQRRNGRVLYRNESRGPIGLDDLSAGYRSTVALATDLMNYMLTRWDDLQAAEGIVLIDELGTHLHPRWQMKVVEAFRQAFPRVQFIATTHDPLCLRGLRDHEVIVLRRDSAGDVFAVSDLPPVENLYVDQLLTSEYFGLGSTRDPKLDDLFAEYYDLLSVREPAPSQRMRLEELEETLAERQQLGTTERERLVLRAADQALAQRSAAGRSSDTPELTDETERLIADLWLESGA